MRQFIIGAALVAAWGCGKKDGGADARSVGQSQSTGSPVTPATEDAVGGPTGSGQIMGTGPASGGTGTVSAADASMGNTGGAVGEGGASAGSGDAGMAMGGDDAGMAMGSGDAAMAMGSGDGGASAGAGGTPLTMMVGNQRAAFMGQDQGTAAWSTFIDPDLGLYVEDRRTSAAQADMRQRWLEWSELQGALTKEGDPIYVTVVTPVRALFTTYDANNSGPDAAMRCDETSRSCRGKDGQYYRFSSRRAGTGDWRLVGVMLYDPTASTTDVRGWSDPFDRTIDARTGQMGWGTSDGMGDR